MASAGTVEVSFAAETARFTSELRKVQSSLKRIEGDFKSMERVAGVALRVFSGAALASFAKQAFEAADATATAAERAGIAIETFSRLQYAAGQTDVEMSGLTTGIQRFQIALSKADDESKQAIATLSRFGIQAETLKNLSIEDQLAAVAEAFTKISDPADRTRLAVELFGKSAGPQLVPLLSQGKAGIAQLTAEADRLGITMSTTTAQGIDQADRAIKQLTQTLSAYTSKFLAGLSIAILGPPDEIQKLDKEIENLQSRRDALLNGGFRRGDFMADPTVIKQAVAGINAEIDKLLAKQRELLNPAPITATPIVQISNAVQTIDLEPIKALKIEVDELALAYTNLATAALNAPIERMREISTIVGSEFADSQRQFQQETSAALIAELENRNAAVAAAAQYQYDVQLRAEESIREQKAITSNAAVGFLQMLGQKNKAAAIAGIALEKAVAIQRLLMHNQEAAQLAYAAALVPGVPASLAAAEAARARVLAQGYVSAALIAGMGVLQIADVTSGRGRSAVGTPLNPAFVSSPVDDGTSAASSVSSVQVIIQGNVIGNQQFIDQMIDGIKNEITDRDVIIIQPNSRQAQEIRGT
jgi:hypothetical protein